MSCWKTLGPVDGFLSLKQLDADAYEAVHSFKTCLGQAAGNLLTGWQTLIDTDGSQRSELPEFKACCERIEFQGNVKLAFKSMQKDPSKPFLHIDDFDKD